MDPYEKNESPSDAAKNPPSLVQLMPFYAETYDISQFLFGAQEDIDSLTLRVADRLKTDAAIMCGTPDFWLGGLTWHAPNKRWAWSIVTFPTEGGRSATIFVTISLVDGQRVYSFDNVSEGFRAPKLLIGPVHLKGADEAALRVLVADVLDQFRNSDGIRQ